MPSCMKVVLSPRGGVFRLKYQPVYMGLPVKYSARSQCFSEPQCTRCVVMYVERDEGAHTVKVCQPCTGAVVEVVSDILHSISGSLIVKRILPLMISLTGNFNIRSLPALGCGLFVADSLQGISATASASLQGIGVNSGVVFDLFTRHGLLFCESDWSIIFDLRIG